MGERDRFGYAAKAEETAARYTLDRPLPSEAAIRSDITILAYTVGVVVRLEEAAEERVERLRAQRNAEWNSTDLEQVACRLEDDNWHADAAVVRAAASTIARLEASQRASDLAEGTGG